MKIAVTDACIFIDLLDLEMTAYFFNMNIEVHTTIEVWNELDKQQQQVLAAYKSVAKLKVHVLESEDFELIDKTLFPRALSVPDQSILYLAKRMNATLLSSDGLVRKFAEQSSIERHGLFWILDELVAQKVITKPVAYAKLTQLTSNNLMYLNNRKLQKDIQFRLINWKG
jgi:predicted nucleic acid-binding protein